MYRGRYYVYSTRVQCTLYTSVHTSTHVYSVHCTHIHTHPHPHQHLHQHLRTLIPTPTPTPTPTSTHTHTYTNTHTQSASFKSTETAITHILDKLHNTASSKYGSIIILLDLSAAFDTINHDILATRLTSIGIRDKNC